MVTRGMAFVNIGATLVYLGLARMRAEEALLRAQFSDEYVAYCTRTPRLIPSLKRRRRWPKN